MKINSVSPVLVVICAFLVVIPGAIVGTPGVVEDELFPEEAPEITVEPAPEAEQHITTTQTADGNTNVSIEIADPGVNADSITEFAELLVITHTDSTNAGSVTVTVEQQDSQLTVGRNLTFLEADDGVGATGSNLTLAPGESETLGIEIDTFDADVGDTLTTIITIKTQVPESPDPEDPDTPENPGTPEDPDTPEDPGTPEDPETPDDPGTPDQPDTPEDPDTPDDSESDSDSDSDSEEESQTPSEEQQQEQQPEQPEQPEQVAPTPEQQGADVEADVETDTETETGTGTETQEQTTATVDVTSISEDSLPEGQTQPNAVIATEASVTAETDATSDLEVSEADIITTTGEEATLSGTRSTVGSTEAVSPSQQVSAAVDISPQSIQADTEATVTLRADQSTLGQINPDEAVIGHLTDGGWQVLETDVAVQGDSVVLEAQTPGFSPFAIFAAPDVRYSWTLPDGSTETGRDIQTEFNEPGIYEAELTVTNSLGQSDTTTQTIVVNDVPTIENVTTTQTQTQAETNSTETTLTANISDEVGNLSVRWEFPDGTVKTGQTVTYPTQESQYTVQVRAEDEYGAEASTVETVVVPPEKTLINQRVVPQQVLVPGILSLIGILGSVAGYRVVPWATIMTRIRRNPRIVELGTPFYEHDNRCLGVDSLVVEDDNRPIIAIRLSIVDNNGDELLTKEITPDGTGTTEIGTYRYELTPATLYVPPTLSIDDTESYTIAVKTVNEKENTAIEHTTEFRFGA